MQTMTAGEICTATHGVLYGVGDRTVSTLSTDSRKIAEGDLFVPLTGDRFDGHDYLEKALELGAVGCLCTRLPETLRDDKVYILVENTRRALRDLAGYYRRKFQLPVVQITGSVGKTTTKEMIASVLSQGLCTLKTQGNLNGDIGAPLTLLGLSSEHQTAVVETGMDNFGQIRHLGVAVLPDVAVITNIGDAHLEFLGSRQGILQAKSEIFENLSPSGFAVLNGDDELLQTITLPQKIYRCGRGEGCNVHISQVENRGVEGISCVVTTEQKQYALRIPAPGLHMVYPAAMAVIIGEQLGLTGEQICNGVAQYAPTGERMRVEHLPQGRLLLNDSYNANPQSMSAAVEILAATDSDRRIAMLGDMKELGEATEGGHRQVGKLVGQLGIDILFAVGEYCKSYLAPTAEESGCRDVRCFANKEMAYEELLQVYTPGSALLLKASHFSGRFDQTADFLRNYDWNTTGEM